MLGRISHREYLSWQWRIEEEWNEPTRSDYYLMRVMAELYRVQGATVSVEQFRLPFEFGEAKPPADKKAPVAPLAYSQMSKEQLDFESAKIMGPWIAMLERSKRKKQSHGR